MFVLSFISNNWLKKFTNAFYIFHSAIVFLEIPLIFIFIFSFISYIFIEINE